ncbi:MAG: winged helix-turn-helix transcriptional regulator [Acidimicrobiales bacterium]
MCVQVTARQQEHSYLCPVDVPLTVLGGKWKLLIAYFLLQAPRRNGELRRLLPTVSQKMLTQQLRELEADGVIVRTVYEQVPPRVDYAIAEGERARLEPLVDALYEWGVSWARDTGGVIQDGEDSVGCAIAQPGAGA